MSESKELFRCAGGFIIQRGVACRECGAGPDEGCRVADLKDRERLTQAEALIEELAGALEKEREMQTNGARLGPDWVERSIQVGRLSAAAMKSYEAWKGAQTSSFDTEGKTDASAKD